MGRQTDMHSQVRSHFDSKAISYGTLKQVLSIPLSEALG